MGRKKVVKPSPSVEAAASNHRGAKSTMEMASPVALAVSSGTSWSTSALRGGLPKASQTSRGPVSRPESTRRGLASRKVRRCSTCSYVSLKVYATDNGQKAEEPAVEIECRFVIEYFLPSMEGLSKENLIAFGGTSGVFSAWPYWREFVHSTSLRLSVPPIILPTYRIEGAN